MAASPMEVEARDIVVNAEGCGSKTFRISKAITVSLEANVGKVTILPSDEPNKIRITTEGVGGDSGIALKTKFTKSGELVVKLSRTGGGSGGGDVFFDSVQFTGSAMHIGGSIVIRNGKTYINGVEKRVPKGRSTSYINGEIYVDGKLWQEEDADDRSAAAPPKKMYPDPTVTLYCPAGLSYAFDTKHSATIHVPREISARDVRFDVYNSSVCTFCSTAQDVTVKAYNGAKVECTGPSLQDLTAESFNSSCVTVLSTIRSARVSAYNGAVVRTQGDCAGSYKAKAYNSGKIRNTGRIGGSVSKECANSGTINLGTSGGKRKKNNSTQKGSSSGGGGGGDSASSAGPSAKRRTSSDSSDVPPPSRPAAAPSVRKPLRDFSDREIYYLGVLGLTRAFTETDLKHAYHTLALEHHPDKKETKDDGKFKEVKEAHDGLSAALLRF